MKVLSKYEGAVGTVDPPDVLGVKSRPLRICMVAYAFYEIDTRILQYASALVEAGHSVDVIALKREDEMPSFELLDGVDVYRIQTRNLDEKGLFTYVQRILRFLVASTLLLYQRHRDKSYDVVHVHNVPDILVFAALAPRMSKVPVILDIHDLLPEFYASKFKVSSKHVMFRLLCLVERISASFATHIIIANDLWHDRFVRRSSREEKCSVIRNRPDLSIFMERAERRHTRSDKYVITYPGSLNWHQGLDVAIRAFARISDQMTDAEFHIYGEGSAKPSLVALAMELNMQGRIHFHPFVPSREIAQIMACSDLAVEPKRVNSAFGNEALSTKILEFMSLGIPIVACRTRIHAHYYDDSMIQYYENDDPVDLARQILLLRYDSKLREAKVQNARTYVRENTWDMHKHEYLDLVGSLVTGKGYAALSHQALIQ